MSKVAIIISPNWRDYAKKYLGECIESIRAQDWTGESKVFLIDNETSEESFGYLKKIVPEAEVVRNKNNDGFAKGNNEAIKLALAQGFDYIVLINMDTIVDQFCIREMVTSAGLAQVGAVQARLMLHPDTEKINSLGNITHFLGFGYSDGYGEKFTKMSLRGAERRGNLGQKSKDEIASPMARNDSDREIVISYPSGAAVLFKREVLEEVGLFDEEFWMYNEDQDIGWRIWLAGYKCILAPDAVVYHKYEFSRSIQKYYWMDRNRILVMLKNYHWLTLLLILPAFFVMEFGLFLFSIKTGWFREKLRVYWYFLNPKKLVYIWQARRQIQALRKTKDKDIVKMFSGRIWYQEIDDWKLRFINPIFNLYWAIVKKIIIW